MINIYICEDDPKQLKHIVRVVEEIVFMDQLDLNVTLATDDPYEIISAVKDQSGINLYFFDVDLDTDINGIQLAEKVRQYDASGAIVFITTHAEMTYLTFKYKIEALDYIIKDDYAEVSKRVKECIFYLYNRMSEAVSKEKVYTIETRDQKVLLPLNEIIAFETSSKKHNVIVHSQNRQVEFYGNLKEITRHLDERFIRCHNAYIINENYVDHIDKKNRSIQMKNGMTIIASVRGLKAWTK